MIDRLRRIKERLFASGEKGKAAAEREKLEQELYASFVTGFDPMGWLGSLPDPDPVLRKSGDGVWVLRELLADDKVIGCIQNRKLGTLKKRDFSFEAGHEEDSKATPEAENLKRRLAKDLERVDLYNVFSQVLDAPYFGFTPVEPIWRAENGWLHIADLKPRPHEWFGFDAAHRLVFRGDEASEIPFGKLVVARHFPDATNPYGLRLLSRCLWPVAIKKGGIRFWVVLCEKFGIPWVVGKARDGAGPDERSEMLQRLTAMVQDAVAVVSGGSTVEIHSAAGKVSGELHAGLVGRMDKAIAFVLMGQTLTADLGSVGSLAAAEVHRDVLADYQESDEALICTFMEELAWIYGQLNAPAALTPSFSFNEPEDLTAMADLDTKLHGVGVRFLPIHFERRYNMPRDEFEMDGRGEGGDAGKPPAVTEKSPKGKGAESSGRGGAEGNDDELSAGDGRFTPDQEALEKFIAKALALGMDDLAANEELIARAVEEAESYEDAIARLLDLYPKLSMKDFEELMESAIFGAESFGVITARRETNG